MSLNQAETARLADLAWHDQMDAKIREEAKSFRRTGRSMLFLLVGSVAVWAFVIYEIVSRLR